VWRACRSVRAEWSQRGESASPVVPTDDGSTLCIRKAATPELEVENLYRALGISSQITRPQHRWNHHPRVATIGQTM
jgi:pterin-4a-carbinolamine dehydratase